MKSEVDHIATFFGFTPDELIELRTRLMAADQLDYLRKYVIERARNAQIERQSEILRAENDHLRNELANVVGPKP